MVSYFYIIGLSSSVMLSLFVWWADYTTERVMQWGPIQLYDGGQVGSHALIQRCRGRGFGLAPIWPCTERGDMAKPQSSCVGEGRAKLLAQCLHGRRCNLAPAEGKEHSLSLTHLWVLGIWWQGRHSRINCHCFTTTNFFQPIGSLAGHRLSTPHLVQLPFPCFVAISANFLCFTFWQHCSPSFKWPFSFT